MVFIHLFDGKVTADVRVEYKECGRISTKNLVPEVIDPSSGPKTTVLLEVPIYQQGKFK